MTQQPPSGWQPPPSNPHPHYVATPQPQPAAVMSKTPLWKRGWLVAVVAGVVGVGIGSAAAGGSDADPVAQTTVSVTATATETVEGEAAPAATITITETAEVPEGNLIVVETPSEQPTPVVASSEPAVNDDVPAEFRAALGAAENYLRFMPFSKAGLFDQLTSDFGNKFAADAAQYAVDNVVVDWNEEALEAAISYRDTLSMSSAGIWDQLTSDFGGKFTTAEADYAIANLPA